MSNELVISTSATDLAAIGLRGRSEVKHPIAQTPTVIGPHGQAWFVDPAVTRSRLGVAAEDGSTLAHWIIEAPWAHPIWHSYALVLVHLRPLPDGRATKLYLSLATHELWLYAMNPDCDRADIIAGARPFEAWMTPINFAAQIVEIRDDLAIDRIRSAVQAICDGTLNPDSDATRQWVALFGDAMLRK
jgi:hypothetical protein